MNYIHHMIIGVGTASLGLMAAEAVGLPEASAVSLATGAVVVAAGSIAVDIDHPKSFISNSIPSRVIRIALAILIIPLLASLGVYLTTFDVQGALNQFTGMLFGVAVLRWTLILLGAALGLMLLSWLLYRTLSHRGPLHSFVFTLGVTIAACILSWVWGNHWWWGLWFGWGWLWHILADGLTDRGVPYLWPFHDQRIVLAEGARARVSSTILSLVSIIGILLLIGMRIAGWITTAAWLPFALPL
jgi:membrane-bound metal-dependent hydrolase YbcI (DUF457 family)